MLICRQYAANRLRPDVDITDVFFEHPKDGVGWREERNVDHGDPFDVVNEFLCRIVTLVRCILREEP